MNKQIKAVPTTYAGTLFKSKSEAVFARAMHIAKVAWVYELVDLDGYKADFLVKLGECKHDDGESDYASFLVEYKPTQPTDSYIAYLISKLENSELDLALVCGSPFNDDDWTLKMLFRKPPAEPAWQIVCADRLFFKPTVAALAEAKAYRFDLK